MVFAFPDRCLPTRSQLEQLRDVAMVLTVLVGIAAGRVRIMVVLPSGSNRRSLIDHERSMSGLSHTGAQITQTATGFDLKGFTCLDGCVVTCGSASREQTDRDWTVATWRSLRFSGRSPSPGGDSGRLAH